MNVVEITEILSALVPIKGVIEVDRLVFESEAAVRTG
jgi:hypothetical protein